jgi:dienelactone hydrolase
MSSFEDLAGDALAAVQLLKTRPDINPKKIGVAGGSEGGWIAEIAASRSRDVAFIVTVAGPAVSYTDEILLETESILRLRGGFSGRDLEDALNFERFVLSTARTGEALTDEGWTKLEAAAEKVKNEKWYSYVALDPRNNYWWRRAPLIANFNPVPLWDHTKIPVLALYGELDRNAPTAKNLERLKRSLETARNKDYTIKVFAKANHEFLEVENGMGFLNESPRLRRFVPGFFDAINEWVLRRAHIRR